MIAKRELNLAYSTSQYSKDGRFGLRKLWLLAMKRFLSLVSFSIEEGSVQSSLSSTSSSYKFSRLPMHSGKPSRQLALTLSEVSFESEQSEHGRVLSWLFSSDKICKSSRELRSKSMFVRWFELRLSLTSIS